MEGQPSCCKAGAVIAVSTVRTTLGRFGQFILALLFWQFLGITFKYGFVTFKYFPIGFYSFSAFWPRLQTYFLQFPYRDWSIDRRFIYLRISIDLDLCIYLDLDQVWFIQMLVSNDPDVNLDLSQCQSRFILISIIIKILGLSVCQLIFGETLIFLCFCDHQFLTILTISMWGKEP